MLLFQTSLGVETGKKFSVREQSTLGVDQKTLQLIADALKSNKVADNVTTKDTTNAINVLERARKLFEARLGADSGFITSVKKELKKKPEGELDDLYNVLKHGGGIPPINPVKKDQGLGAELPQDVKLGKGRKKD